MGRMPVELLDRAERFCDRGLAVVRALPAAGVERRLVGQIASACTSVGANLFEADQAVSRADFCRCLGIAVKELSETRFWVRLIARQGWLAPDRLSPLEAECLELQRILNAMIRNTKRADRSGPAAHSTQNPAIPSDS